MEGNKITIYIDGEENYFIYRQNVYCKVSKEEIDKRKEEGCELVFSIKP